VDPAPQYSMLGEFRVAAVLGQGGSGIVYDATWGPRRVALKVLHPSLVGTGKERSQFLAEAQGLQQIAHPSVVKVLACGELPDGRPYLAMERLEGETLARLIAGGALPLGRALELFAELSAAVAALHAQGLVHRDLKPENVFVVDGRHAVLLDFGIAKGLDAPASTTTQEGHVRGTPAYMAPERFFGQPAGIATDIYELAVVLYVMLAGRLPWDDVADPETRLSPRPLVELAPMIPEALDIELRRALSTRAQNRPSSAIALHDAIRGAAEGASTEPEAGETARLRQGAHDEVTAQQRTPSAEHPTPLAWAPEARRSEAPVASARAPRRRTALVLGLGAVAIAGGATAWWRLRDDVAPRASSQVTVGVTGAGDDPWAPHATREAPRATHFAAAADKLDSDAYRKESAAAIQTLPSNTRFVASIVLADIRANQQTAVLLERVAKHPKLAAFALVVPTCVRTMLGDAEWIVYGTTSIASSGGTMVIRGRWARADVEACIATTNANPQTVEYLDEHTVSVTLASRPSGDHKGPGKHVMDLLARLPDKRSVAIVEDGAANDDWSNLDLPRGTDLFGSLLVEQSGATLDLAVDPHDAASAKTLVDKVRPQLDSVFANADIERTGKIDVRQDGTVVHIAGRMTSLMLGIVTSAVQP
jgi:predicted Ser/Thr protein kinase